MLKYYVKWNDRVCICGSMDKVNKILNQKENDSEVHYLEYGQWDLRGGGHIPMVVVKNDDIERM